jgi:hypothetical protein
MASQTSLILIEWEKIQCNNNDKPNRFLSNRYKIEIKVQVLLGPWGWLYKVRDEPSKFCSLKK